MDTELEKGVLLTLKYFDLFDYPLTREEIWRWFLGVNGEVGGRDEMGESLDKMVERKQIINKNSFYFLPGREGIIDQRRKREKISLLKIKKARRVARLIGTMPGVKMIAICSNLGYLNADDEADIDFFIVSEAGKIWQVRFWAVFWMKILGQRPGKDQTKNKICLSYFVSEDNLNLKATAIGEPDIHLVYLLAQYLPIYSENECWEKFVVANDWIKKYLPNFQYNQEAKRFLVKPRFLWLKKFFALLGKWPVEQAYKKFQLKIMPQGLTLIMNNGEQKVIVNDRMLKLHGNDKRAEINSKISKTQFPISPPIFSQVNSRIKKADQPMADK